MHERFTDRARKVLQFALHEAERLGADYIGTEHILLGIVKEGSGMATVILTKLGINLQSVRTEIEETAGGNPDLQPEAKLKQTSATKKSLENAIEQARNHNQGLVGTEHLLLGLLGVEDDIAAQVLHKLGVTLDRVRKEIEIRRND